MSEENKTTTPSWFNPEYPPLKSTDDIGKASVNGQVIEYPQVVRKMVDPVISGQEYGNISFMLFEKPRMFRGKPIYGYAKMRGNHSNSDACRFDAYRIIREVDSKFQVRIAKVGNWVPITENDSVVEDLYDVRNNDEEKHLRDEIVKEKEKESRRLANEIREAEEALKTGDDIYDKPESLDFYTMKRVTEMRIVEAVEIAERKLKELYNTLAETHMILHILDEKNPEYKNEWIDNYNFERSKTSIQPFVPSSKQFELFENSNLEKLREEHPTIAEKVDEKMKTYGKK